MSWPHPWPPPPWPKLVLPSSTPNEATLVWRPRKRQPPTRTPGPKQHRQCSKPARMNGYGCDATSNRLLDQLSDTEERLEAAAGRSAELQARLDEAHARWDRLADRLHAASIDV